jgi:hypothetical protein
MRRERQRDADLGGGSREAGQQDDRGDADGAARIGRRGKGIE